MVLIGRRDFLGAVGMVSAGVLAGCTSGENDSTESTTGKHNTQSQSGGTGGGGSGIPIGVLLPFTGEYSWVGANVFPVAKMIVQQINQGNRINGQPITLVKGDTEATVDASVTAARKLINVENVRAIIGPTSLTFTGVKDLIVENNVPVVTPTAGTTELDSVGGNYIFRTVPSDSLGGRAISKAVRNKKYNGTASYKRMGLLVGKAPALQSFKKPIQSSFEEFGGTITRTMDYATGKSSYQSELSKLLRSNPELIALVGTPEDSAKIMRAAFQAGYQGNWFVTQDQTNKKFLELVDSRITDGIIGLQEADNPNAEESGRVEQFVSEFKKFSGKDPGLFAKNTFDAMTVTALAMKAAATDSGSDSEITRQAIASKIPTVANAPKKTVTTYKDGASALEAGTDIDYEGLVGPVNFDTNGDIRSPFAIMRVDGGQWKHTATLPASELQ